MASATAITALTAALIAVLSPPGGHPQCRTRLAASVAAARAPSAPRGSISVRRTHRGGCASRRARSKCARTHRRCARRRRSSARRRSGLQRHSRPRSPCRPRCDRSRVPCSRRHAPCGPYTVARTLRRAIHCTMSGDEIHVRCPGRRERSRHVVYCSSSELFSTKKRYNCWQLLGLIFFSSFCAFLVTRFAFLHFAFWLSPLRAMIRHKT